MTWLAGIVGVLLFLLVAGEAFEVMLLPRRVRRSARFVRVFFRSTWKLWAAISKWIRAGAFRDGFLSLYGPLSMLFLLSNWAFLLIISLGLLQWAVQQSTARPLTLTRAIYFSGSSFFTVGYGDVLPTNPVSKILSVCEAGCGLAFIAVTIGYLPVLYQLFSRREAQVIQLDARAGSPPTGTALLCRHGEEDIHELQALLGRWEDWCAVLVESHLSYPMLSYYRSQHDNQSWLAALTALLDCCALISTGVVGVRTFTARMTFALARLACLELCRVFHLRMQVHMPDRLSDDDFAVIQEALEESGLRFTEEETAQERLGALRATYEPFLFALSEYFLLPLPGWAPSVDPDNWQRSSRGRSAARILGSSPVEPR